MAKPTPEDPSTALALSMGQPYPDRARTFDAFARHVSGGKAARFRELGFDVVMGKREGPFFYDAFEPSRRYWNCHSNGGVFNLGHCPPSVVAAVRDALQGLDVGNHHLVSGYRARLAERLSATTEHRLSGVVFGVAGGEAIDLAIKVARWATRRRTIVSACGGYHGHTGLALAAGDPKYRAPFGENLPGFVQVPFDDLGALERAVGDDTAAVLLEPIPATLGMPIARDGYLTEVARLCTERGAKLVMDEVQTGLGRTGRMWAHEAEGVRPDAIVTGKGLSGGVYPISATLMTRELHALFDEEPFVHISTFGGAEPGCVAALAVLDAVEAPGFLARVERQGAELEARFAGLPFTLRRRGLMMGLKFDEPMRGMFASKLLLDRGVFTVWANNDDSVTQFLPPLVLEDVQVKELGETVRAAFGVGGG